MRPINSELPRSESLSVEWKKMRQELLILYFESYDVHLQVEKINKPNHSRQDLENNKIGVRCVSLSLLGRVIPIGG